MDQQVERVAGLDVHRDTVVACARLGRPERLRVLKKRFATTAAGIDELSRWLADLEVERVVMESTGVYWKPVYYGLEGLFAELWLVNARHVKNVPGRKTDMADAEWLADVAAHGMVRPSLVPQPAARELRELTRYRKSLVTIRAQEVQRLDKVLQDAGIKISSVASTVLGKSTRAMVEALIAGERDPAVLAAKALGKMRPKNPRAHRGPRRPLRCPPRRGGQGCARPHRLLGPQHRRARPGGGRPSRVLLGRHRATKDHTRRWPNRGRGLCGRDRWRHVPLPERQPLSGLGWGGAGQPRVCRQAPPIGDPPRKQVAAPRPDRSGQGRGPHQRHLSVGPVPPHRGWRGPNKATVAVAHSILFAAWHMLTTGQVYDDLGPDWFKSRRNPEYETRRLVARLEALGHTVTLTAA